jgi:hypothetical protein
MGQIRQVVRHGELTVVPVVHRVIPAQGGQTATTELSIDMESAPIPTRRYTANSATARLQSETVQFIFAQRKIVGTGLRSLVAVSISFEAIAWFRRSYSNMLPSLRKVAKEKSIQRPDPLDLGNEEPGQAVEMTANLIAIAFVGRDACIDLYSASPFSFRALRNNGAELPIEPLLRVDLTSGALLSMVEELEAFAAQLPVDSDNGSEEHETEGK